MLRNKIYQNFLTEIFKTFFIVLFGLSLIALTFRAVNFLDLIIESGYSTNTYFKFSLLNLFGIAPKFVPLSFLITLTLFILKHLQNSEFIILWTSGVKKLQLLNLFIFSSLLVMSLYLCFSTFLTPLALNKSRQLLSSNNFNSFLPTIKPQQFSDSFKGFTFFVETKNNNEIKNIFLHDRSNNLKNFSSNISEINSTSIFAENGIIENKRMLLFNGHVLSSKKDSNNEIIKFEKLSIDLSYLKNSTIKEPKIQETSTIKLIGCLIKKSDTDNICSESFIKEILPNLSRRIIVPFYIPIISLIVGLMLIKSKKIYYNKICVFAYSFLILLFTELSVRYTGINNFVLILFMLVPFCFFLLLYFFLIFKFGRENKTS